MRGKRAFEFMPSVLHRSDLPRTTGTVPGDERNLGTLMVNSFACSSAVLSCGSVMRKLTQFFWEYTKNCSGCKWTRSPALRRPDLPFPPPSAGIWSGLGHAPLVIDACLAPSRMEQ